MLTRRLLIGLLLSFQVVVAADTADFTLDDYFQLTKARLQVAAIEWQARIDSAQQAKGDRKMLLTRSSAISKQFGTYHRQMHAKYGTNPAAFMRYGTEHAKEIESYLEENPQVKHEIESLRQTVEGLMQTFDSIANPMLTGVQK